MGHMWKEEVVYKCDPAANQGCRKTSCFLCGGPCRATTNCEYAVKGTDGKPIALSLKRGSAFNVGEGKPKSST